MSIFQYMGIIEEFIDCLEATKQDALYEKMSNSSYKNGYVDGIQKSIDVLKEFELKKKGG